MKQFITYLFILGVGTVFSQQFQGSVYTTFDFPDRAAMPKMGVVKGIGLMAAFRPAQQIPVFLEMKGSLGNYSARTIPQTYVFTNGDQTSVDVRYSSAMNKWLFGTRIQLGNEYRRFNWFITPQIGGAHFNSRIYIEDPTVEEGECRALENRIPHRDNVFVYGGEIGIQLNLSDLGKGAPSNYQHRVSFSLNFLNSAKKVDYINVKYMSDEPHPVVEGGSHEHDDRELTATFINLTSNATHQHKIAELYSTTLRMWGFNVGYVFMF